MGYGIRYIWDAEMEAFGNIYTNITLYCYIEILLRLFILFGRVFETKKERGLKGFCSKIEN